VILPDFPLGMESRMVGIFLLFSLNYAKFLEIYPYTIDAS
jgi:hypothetical protein